MGRRFIRLDSLFVVGRLCLPVGLTRSLDVAGYYWGMVVHAQIPIPDSNMGKVVSAVVRLLADGCGKQDASAHNCTK